MKTFNTYFTSPQELKKFIKDSGISDSNSLLIQIFTSNSDEIFISSLTTLINEILPLSSLVGSTTDGEIKDGLVSTSTTVISFTIFEKTLIKTYISDSFENYFEAGISMAEHLNEPNLKVIISFIDGICGNGEDFLSGIDSVNKDVIVAGGLAADNGQFKTTYVFTKDKVFKNGVVGVGLSSEFLNVHTDYSFDWIPIGLSLKITKAIGNRVYTINDKTAYEIYAHYLGRDIARKLPAGVVEFSLMVKRNGVDVARTVISSEHDGSLIFGGNFKDGDMVRFAYGDKSAILSHTKQNIQKIAKNPIESIFIYSCMARKKLMPELIENETKPFNKIAPTAGFFAYGEFYTSANKQLLNQSMTVLALSESETINKSINFDDEKELEASELITMKTLSHLIKVSSNELEILNITLENEVEDEIEKNRDKTQQIIDLNYSLEQRVQEQVDELREKDIVLMQQELERQQLILSEEKAKLNSSAKSSFLANMSHEIRTPMNAILGFINILIKNETSPEKISKLAIVQESSNVLLEIINDILDFSKIESGKLSIEKVLFLTKDPFIITSELFYEKAQEKNITLNLNFDDKLPLKGWGDTTRIKQIYSNLLSNAIKFSPQNSQIDIGVLYDQAANKLTCSVKDYGIGIKPENITKIFTAFEQEDSSITRRFGGTGLGLSICKKLIEIMGGRLEVKSEFNHGSTFSFYLDIFSNIPDVEQEEKLKFKSDEISFKGKVLVVEDNKSNQLLMRLLLEEFGLETIVIANDGLEGVEAYKNEKFSLIFMDENMPNMNGIEATKQIRELESKKQSTTPIIAVTANALVEDKKRFLDAGMNDYIAKPILHSELQRVLSKYL